MSTTMKVASQYAGFGRQESSAAEDWMAEQHLAAMARRPKAAHQMAVAEAAAAAEEVKFAPKPADEVKFAPKLADAEKKTRVVRVDKAFIDSLVAYLPRRPLPPIPDFACFSPELRDGARARLQRAAADIQKSRDFCADLQEQYRAKGYAEIIEDVVSDDEEEEECIVKLKARLGI